MNETISIRQASTGGIKEAIADILKEAELVDPVLSARCPHWWHSVSKQIDNGMIDTFTCRRHVCTDVILQRPYTLDDLAKAIQKHCKGAQNDEWYCDECAGWEVKQDD